MGLPQTHIVASRVTRVKTVIVVPITDILEAMVAKGWQRPMTGDYKVRVTDANTLEITHESEIVSREDIAMYPAPLAPVVQAGMGQPPSPEDRPKHTCGIDGDPGATAPLDGRCAACEDEAKMASQFDDQFGK